MGVLDYSSPFLCKETIQGVFGIVLIKLLLMLVRPQLTKLVGAINRPQLLLGVLLSVPVALCVSNFFEKITKAIAEKRAKLKYKELSKICCNLSPTTALFEKYKELANICCNLSQNTASFEDVERWLNESQNDYLLLRQAANYGDEIDLYPYREKYSTPLHYLVCAQPPFQMVQRILQLAPNAIEKKNYWGYLPLHNALRYNASHDVIEMLFETYPHAAKVQNKQGFLPLHHACCCKDSLDIIKLLLDAYPDGAKVQNCIGFLPLHIACCNNASTDVIKVLFEAYPEAVGVRDKTGNLPLHLLCLSITGSIGSLLESLDLMLVVCLDSIDVKDNSGRTMSDYLKPRVIPEFLMHYAIISGFSTPFVKLLAEICRPQDSRTQDSSDVVSLHHVYASYAPHFFDYVGTLLDAAVDKSLMFQDNHGTATQLVIHAASIADENGRLPLHRLASRSNNLTVKALNLLVDAYPDSLIFPDKFGMLPFHHACLNEASSLEVLMFFINSFPGSLEVF